ncbi:MAG: hypothetical protein D6712_00290 [Chloroflexi bacterium]|nr:MAG: hypothetical protein D6712_00290 [Chloroflexota bacterium]
MGYFSSIISVGDETIELLVKVFPPTQRDNSDVVIVITSGYRTFRQTFEVVNADGVIKVRVGEDTVMRQIDSFINQVVDDIVKRHVAKNNLYRSL